MSHIARITLMYLRFTRMYQKHRLLLLGEKYTAMHLMNDTLWGIYTDIGKC